MARFNIELLGDKELIATLQSLPENMERKILGQAIKEAAKVVLAAAKSRAPRGATGNLARYLKIKALKRSRRRLGYGVFTGTREQMGLKAGAKGYYPAHVHLGREIRNAEFGTRHVPAKPFLRSALIENEPTALARLAEAIRQRLGQLGI